MSARSRGRRAAPGVTVPVGAGALDGVLVVDKPSGPTSHDVVVEARRLLLTPRVGHTGTLDPAATGVLPLVLGRATRLARFLTGGEKAYEATVRLGLSTDTFDVEGKASGSPWGGFGEAEGRARVSDPATIEAALAGLSGTYEQAPPPFSAKKIEGVRAYEMARAGRPVQPKPVSVTVTHLALVGLDGEFAHLAVTASSGFYVRVLADELGRRLGVGGHLVALRRTRSGPFGLAHSVTLAELAHDPASARLRVIPLERLLDDLPTAFLTDLAATKVLQGREIGPADMVTAGPPESPDVAGPVRLLGPDGRLLAIGEPSLRPRFLRPAVVLG